MLISFPYLLHVFALVISVSAISSTSSAGSGAAYFITNDLAANEILAMNIASDGTLSGVTATGTGGRGYRSPIPPTLLGSSLHSSGAIKTNAAKKILVAVNPGSNSLSLFKIDPYNPAQLTMIGSPVSSEGQFPVSTAINDQGTMVCVLNAGTINGVNCYKPHLELGLIAIPNTLRSLELNLTKIGGASGSPSQVVFSEDGQTLIAAVKGVLGPPATPGFLAAWAIERNGSLSAEFIKSTAPAGGFNPFSMTLIPGTTAILSADPASGGVGGVDIFDFESSQSAQASAFAIPGQKATCWSSYSSRSGNFYLTDPVTSIITEFNVDENLQGTIVKQYQQAASSGSIDNDIASVGSKYRSFLYILAANALTVDVFDVSIAGDAVMVQNFNFTLAANKVGITPDRINVSGMTTFVNKYRYF